MSNFVENGKYKVLIILAVKAFNRKGTNAFTFSVLRFAVLSSKVKLVLFLIGLHLRKGEMEEASFAGC